MKIEDISAIQNMNPKEHFYLQVVGQGADQHLCVIHRNWFGRLWMKLGFSSSSMEKVSQYILNHEEDFDELDPSSFCNFTLLREKLEHYSLNHLNSKSVAQSLNIITIKELDEFNVKIEIESPPRQTPTIKRKLDIKNFINQFEQSAPRINFYDRNSKNEARKIYHQEINKLEEYLKFQNDLDNCISHDLVYISVGHADVDEQVWPAFIFDALANDHRVLTVLFEDGCKYPDLPLTALSRMGTQLQYQSPEAELIIKNKNLSNFSVQQFLCGFPYLKEKFEDQLTIEEQQHYFISSNIYWKKQKQAVVILDLFYVYLDRLLKEGKLIVIGAHAGMLDMDDPLVSIYNKLIEQYPEHIHFLWGWERCNLLSHQELKKEDLNKMKQSSTWIHYEHLKDCHL